MYLHVNYKLACSCVHFFYGKPLSREVSLNRVLLLRVAAHRGGHRTPHSTDERDLPIYTAGLTGAMRVKFLAQGNNSNSN